MRHIEPEEFEAGEPVPVDKSRKPVVMHYMLELSGQELQAVLDLADKQNYTVETLIQDAIWEYVMARRKEGQE